MELILIAVLTVITEVLVLRAFEKRSEKRWDRGKAERTSDESFWQNIISYDHKKGGGKK